MRVVLAEAIGDFGGDKDEARAIRETTLAPATRAGEPVALDFAGVELVTQSFVHALVSDLVRSSEFDALELITFENCNPSVRELVEIVVEYSQEDVTDRLAEDAAGAARQADD
jgi:anti-anti-sigma regulatory factor